MGRSIQLVIQSGKKSESVIWENEFDGPLMLELGKSLNYEKGVVAEWWGWTATRLAEELGRVDFNSFGSETFAAELADMKHACMIYDLCTVKTYS